MDIERAKEILGFLADGIDPFTGALLDEDSICNQAEVVRAFHAIQTELEKASKKKLPENNGNPWTEEADQELLEMYDTGSTEKELSEYFKRTKGAIHSRLKHLGKIEG
ncbi:MAG: hypothetical protein Q4A83_06600 [Bacillota bacterium]|nr:hypothetical protein [Bacillota bacterium]